MGKRDPCAYGAILHPGGNQCGRKWGYGLSRSRYVHRNINFSGKAITVISDQGPALTVIDGNNNGPVATFVSGEGPQSVLNGFTIQHGSAQFVPILNGGGVRIENSSPGIAGNVITSNNAGAAGGGIYILSGSPLIQSNKIINNGQANFSGGIGGGGIAIEASTAKQHHL